jgi:hypothetical protein
MRRKIKIPRISRASCDIYRLIPIDNFPAGRMVGSFS